MTKLVHTIAEMRSIVSLWHSKGEKVGLVPTMGALHAGHLSLVEAVRAKASRTITTIFVNPTQFAPHEDFAKYPRTLESDVQKLKSIACDLVFCPSVEEMYPHGFSTEIQTSEAAKAGLEDAFRPTHFTGVATIVMKLLNQSKTDYAIFGEKDYQQLAVIKQVCRDLNHPCEILAGVTLREADGLAMSSRNVYLSQEERKIAPEIYTTLTSSMSLTAMKTHLTALGFRIDYLEKRDAITLQAGNSRILFAGYLGKTRLIDNVGC
jgi:pantoate--beta-alanine ligase